MHEFYRNSKDERMKYLIDTKIHVLLISVKVPLVIGSSPHSSWVMFILDAALVSL